MTAHYQDAWTPEERELVAKLWKQGLSAANVAVNVKTRRASRNAIIGLVNRMGLQRPKAAVCATRTYTCRANAGVAKINARVDHLPRQILSQPPRLLRLVAAPDHLPTLDTRERHACCRPIGDVPKGSGAEQRFCGAPRPAPRPYCDACAAELFQPLTAEQKRRHGRMVSWLGARG